jgi:lipid-A-disaccharide synthase-like uncharacterized protein
MMAHLLTWLTVNHTSCTTTIYVWFLVGFLGQALFTSRFIVQWFKSEIVGKSVIPLAFWWFSVGGGVIMLVYSIYRMDPVFIAGQAGGLIVYARNLYLIFRERAAERRSAA